LKLIIGLNKKGINVTEKQYLEEWDIPITNAAVEMAKFTREEVEEIWIIERDCFEMF
jgi:hypothetical protein